MACRACGHAKIRHNLTPEAGYADWGACGVLGCRCAGWLPEVGYASWPIREAP